MSSSQGGPLFSLDPANWYLLPANGGTFLNSSRENTVKVIQTIFSDDTSPTPGESLHPEKVKAFWHLHLLLPLHTKRPLPQQGGRCTTIILGTIGHILAFL